MIGSYFDPAEGVLPIEGNPTILTRQLYPAANLLFFSAPSTPVVTMEENQEDRERKEEEAAGFGQQAEQNAADMQLRMEEDRSIRQQTKRKRQQTLDDFFKM